MNTVSAPAETSARSHPSKSQRRFGAVSEGGVHFSIARAALPWLAVAAFGMVEGLFGRTQYLGDWISYLNVSRAVSSLDWPAIFNPMWNPGYPLLIALARGLAPRTAEGEWYAITFLNLIIFVGAYAAWRHLVRSAIAFYRPVSVGMAQNPIAVWTITWLFLGCALGLQNVSAVSPDLLVMMVFILATAQTLSLIRRRTLRDAIVLGLVLGLAIWVKGIFNALACIFLLVICIDCFVKGAGWRLLSAAVAVYVPFFAWYVAAISWSSGELTFGATGPLNYAFHVNHVPHFTNWQGGPPPFGMPFHPTRQLIYNLPLFEFASPFRSTYTPYNDLAYWYQGLQQVHNLQLQIQAISWSVYFLAKIALDHPIVLGVSLALLVSLLTHEWRQAVWNAAKSCWMLFLPALLGIATYLAVMVEERYLGGFVLVLGLLPLAPLLKPELERRRILVAAMALIMSGAALAEIAHTDRGALSAAIYNVDFHGDPQWKLAAALSAHGLREGDTVAMIRDAEPPYRVHWAYVSGLRIVAEFGGVPWRLDPRIRNKDSAPDPGDVDYAQVFWEQLSPTQRAAVMEAFRSTGARAVISLSRPKKGPDSGWTELSGAKASIYDFPR